MATQKHIAELLIEYAMAQGCTPASLKEANWHNTIDERWELKCNGTKEKRDGLEPYSWYIYFNGWPAGVLSLLGEGVLCAGDAGNEENLRKAIEGRMVESN